MTKTQIKTKYSGYESYKDSGIEWIAAPAGALTKEERIPDETKKQKMGSTLFLGQF